MNVCDWVNMDLRDLKLKLSYMTSKSKIILSPIKYKRQNFICQTPPALVLNRLPTNNISGKKFYKIPLFFEYYTFNKKSKEFIEKIMEIETFLIKKYSSIINNKTFIPSIKTGKSNEDVFFNVNIQIFNNKLLLPIFDYKKAGQPLEYILPRSRTVNIVYLKDMWSVNNRVGFNWILLQTKVYLPFLHIKDCLIVEGTDDTVKKNTHNISPGLNIFDKYIKMRKFGVPEKAIKVELEKNQLSYYDFMNFEPLKTQNNIPPTHHALIKKPLINMSMLLGVKLKKSKKKRRRKIKPKKEPPVNTDTKNYRPPTKELLAELIRNLKKNPVEMPLL